MLGDEVDLLTRSYSSATVNHELIKRLCNCSEVVDRLKLILLEMDSLMTVRHHFGIDSSNQAISGGQAETILRNLRERELLSARDLGSAFKKCGCLNGLRILRDFETSN
ncbi:hypothetical protein BOX15_Mlig001164g2 [Macrostomum lignano]|uniref:Uncharacterized protein n=1 Tax=Macrostomum lignano TaxID=282301 RepID=A0A267DR48_9PLAT|nr:hypothetical protein BOX15_Mlig001164g2 [Macrostomum lignano]